MKGRLCLKRQKEERERLRRFAVHAALLRAGGRTQRDRTLSARRAGVGGTLAALPFAAAAAALYLLFAPCVRLVTGSLLAEPFFAAAALIALLPAHEGVHALAAAAVHGTFSGIRVRFFAPPQCCCARASRRAQYAFTALAPFVLLGCGLSAAGIAAGFVSLLVCGAFGCLIAGADLLVAVRALAAGRGALLLDHPVRCGFFAFLCSGG